MEQNAEFEQGGVGACRSGKALEETVREMLKGSGYVELTPPEKKLLIQQNGDVSVIHRPIWFVEQLAIHESIYKTKWKLDFFLYHKDRYPNGLYIESKYQKSSGSVDEKYVFTVLSMKLLPTDSILIFEGGGARPGAINWIKRETAKANSKITFHTLSSFLNWKITHLK